MLYIGRVCKYGDQPRANSRNNPAGQIIARGRNISARAEPSLPRSLSLSLLARENAHLLTFYNSMLIKSSNIVLRATIINHASSSRAHVRSALSPPIFQDYRIRNHCPIVPSSFLRIRDSLKNIHAAPYWLASDPYHITFYDSREERNSVGWAGFHRGVKLSLADFKGDAKCLYLARMMTKGETILEKF